MSQHTRGRAMSVAPPRPVVEIAADGQATIARMKTDAERLRDLGAEAKAGLAQAVANAEAMIGQMFEAGAKAVCEKLDELERVVGHKEPEIKNGNPPK